MSANLVAILMGGVFHAAVLFLVSAGLQLVFGVQKIFNLACGSFYALGAYVGVSAVALFVSAGGPPSLFILPLILAGLLAGAVGLVVERGLETPVLGHLRQGLGRRANEAHVELLELAQQLHQSLLLCFAEGGHLGQEQCAVACLVERLERVVGEPLGLLRHDPRGVRQVQVARAKVEAAARLADQQHGSA